MSCEHVFAICHLSDAPFGTALVCTACKLYLCPDPACNAPVFAKHCPSGLKRAHFAHYGGTDAAKSGCTGGSPESVEHLRAKEALRDLVLSCQGRWLTIKENFCNNSHYILREIFIPVGTVVELELPIYKLVGNLQKKVQPDVLVTLPDGKRFGLEAKHTSYTKNDRPFDWWEVEARREYSLPLECIRYRTNVKELQRDPCQKCAEYEARKRAADERRRAADEAAQRRAADEAAQRRDAGNAAAMVMMKRQERGKTILANLEKKSVSEMKALCRTLFISTSGRRADLQERLRAYGMRMCK